MFYGILAVSYENAFLFLINIGLMYLFFKDNYATYTSKHFKILDILFFFVQASFEIISPCCWIFVERWFCKELVIFIVLAQNSSKRVLLISSESFIVTIVLYPCLSSPFFMYMYDAAYFIIILFFLPNSLNLIKMNSSFPLTWKIFIDILLSFSTFRNQVWKVSTNSTFKLKYIIHVL